MIINKVEKPDVCGYCEHCDYSVAEGFGDCLLTDEELWDIWNSVGNLCPYKEENHAASKETKAAC